MKQKKILMMMMMAATLAGCSSDDNEPQKLGATSRPMIVDVEEIPISNGETPAPKSLISRGADPTTTATLSSFSMNYMNNDYAFTKTGETWSTNTWPSVADNVKIDFYAYSHGTFNYNSGNPYLSFTVQEAASSQYDLLVAEHKNISRSDAYGHVSLRFKHACAAVRFSVQITNTLRDEVSTLPVKSITLMNVNSQGNYYYSTKSWSDQAVARPYTLTSGEINVTTEPQQLTFSNYLYMIPQKCSANGTTGIYLDIVYDKGAGGKHATIPLNIDWKAGELYPINIKLGTSLIQ